MRVFSVLLSLLCLSGVSAQFALLSSSTNAVNEGYYFNVSTLPDPTLNVTAGNSYTFDISAITSTSPPHPFYFSSAQNPSTTTLAPLDPTVFTVTVGSACVPTNNAYTGNGCILTLTINATATNQTIWYKCTFHSAMNGPIVVTAAPATGNTTDPTTVAPTTAAPTTAAPTTAAPTTAAPTNNTGNTTTAAPTTLAPTTVAPGNTTGNATTGAPTTLAPTTTAPTTGAPTTPAPTTGGTIASNTFRITGNALTNAYLFTANNVQYANPTLTVTAGSAVTFSFELPNSRFHPFGFSNNSSPTLAATQLNDTTVFPNELQTYTTTTCLTNAFTNIKTVYANVNTTCTITVPAAQVQQGTLYYRCARHPAMVGTINVVAAPGSSSSTGGNSASTITLSGLTIVVAFIAALMA